MANQSNLKDKELAVLQTELKAMELELHELKFDNAVSTLANTAQIKEKRRSIARYLTEIRSRELTTSTQKRDKIRARRRREKK